MQTASGIANLKVQTSQVQSVDGKLLHNDCKTHDYGAQVASSWWHRNGSKQSMDAQLLAQHRSQVQAGSAKVLERLERGGKSESAPDAGLQGDVDDARTWQTSLERVLKTNETALSLTPCPTEGFQQKPKWAASAGKGEAKSLACAAYARDVLNMTDAVGFEAQGCTTLGE
eukprot:189658-Amphidinium_carterae.1